LLASYVLERTCKRRQMMLVFGLMQRLVWIPFGLIPFLLPLSGGALRLWAAVVMVLVSSVSGPFINVAFYSICSDVIPIRIRGRYFAVRSRNLDDRGHAVRLCDRRAPGRAARLIPATRWCSPSRG
jgi:hypothetical protein